VKMFPCFFHVCISKFLCCRFSEWVFVYMRTRLTIYHICTYVPSFMYMHNA
jgi:hypothetical protein